MEEIIHAGLASAESTVEIIQSRVLTDRVAKAEKVRVKVDDEGKYVLVIGGSEQTDGYVRSVDGPVELHDHARDQVFQNARMPKTFEKAIVDEAGGQMWGKLLIAQNVNEVLSRRKDQRNLIRHEGDANGQVKGFLSDKVRRLDSRPLLDACMGAAGEIGLVPVQGVSSDTKCRVRAIMPQVFEPIPNEVMLFGVEWGNSDYGDGGHVVNLFCTRVWCTNMAMMEKCLRQIHLGKALSDDISYSDRTYQLDTKTNVSALKDTVKHVIGPAKINGMLAAIKAAGSSEIKGKDGIDGILKKFLDNKSDVEKVKALYEGPDVQNLPAGNTIWRLSNAVSFFAQAKGISADRRLELEQAAGDMVPHKQAEALAF